MAGGVLGGLLRLFVREKNPQRKQICITTTNEADEPGKLTIPSQVSTILDLSGFRPFRVSTLSLQDLSTKSIPPSHIISSVSLGYLDPILFALSFWP